MSIQLIDVDSHGNLFVPQEAEAALSSRQIPLSIVGIAGRYRTGKSTLISRLVEQQDAFAVGHSVSSCTHGILLHETERQSVNDTQVLVLDSEGLNALDSNIQHDVRIFALTVLLSSTFVYNVQGALDESTLNSLKVVTDFVEMMCKPGDEEDHSLASVAAEMPVFVTVVRDFSLKLERPDGSSITADDWLEDALATTTSTGQDTAQQEDKAAVRATVKRLFPDRRCFTLPRPSADESVLGRMDTASDADLRPEFLSAMQNLKRHVIDNAPAKTIMGEKMTGAGLLHVAKLLVAAINDARTPEIRESWVLLGQIRAQQTMARLTQEVFRVTANWADSKMAMPDLERALSKLRDTTVAKFVEDVGSNEELLAKFKESIQERTDAILLSARARRIELLTDYLSQCRDRSLEQVGSCDSEMEVKSCWEWLQGQMDDVVCRVNSMKLDASSFGQLCGTTQDAVRLMLFPALQSLLAVVMQRFEVAEDIQKIKEVETTMFNLNVELQKTRKDAEQQITHLRAELEHAHDTQLKVVEASHATIQTSLQSLLDDATKEKALAEEQLLLLRGARVEETAKLSELQSQLEHERTKNDQCVTDINRCAALSMELDNAKHEGQMQSERICELERQKLEGDLYFKDQLQESRKYAEECISKKKRKLEEMTVQAQSREDDLITQNELNGKAIDRARRDYETRISHLQAKLDSAKQLAAERASQQLQALERQATVCAESDAKVNLLRNELSGLSRAHKNEWVQCNSERRLELVQANQTRAELEIKLSKLEMKSEQTKRALERQQEIDVENKRLLAELQSVSGTKVELATQNEMLKNQMTMKVDESIQLKRQLNVSIDKCNQLERDKIKLAYDLSIHRAM